MLQVDEGTAHVLGASVSETVQIYVSYAVGAHTVIWQVWQRDGTALDAHLHLLAC